MMRSMKEANKTPSHLLYRVIFKQRRTHKLLTGRKKLAIQQHLTIPKRENTTYLRRERSSICSREAVLPEDVGYQYQVPLDERFPGKTITGHARPAFKPSAKSQTIPMPKRLPSKGMFDGALKRVDGDKGCNNQKSRYGRLCEVKHQIDRKLQRLSQLAENRTELPTGLDNLLNGLKHKLDQDSKEHTTPPKPKS